MNDEKVEYLLIYNYHNTFVDRFDNLGLLRIALTNLKEIFKNDSDFKYEIYCGKNITDKMNELESGDK